MPIGKPTASHGDVRFGAGEGATLDLCGARFEDCTFERCDMRGRDLRGASFIDCNLIGCDLVVAKVTGCVLSRVKFRECRLGGINWSLANKLESVSFEGCQLNDGTFLGLRLDGCAFLDCAMNGASFRDANLAKVDFRGSKLAGAEFVNCDLRGADFRGAVDYALSPTDNRLEKARFSLPEAVGLLRGLGIVLD